MPNLELSPARQVRIHLIAPDPDQPRRSITPEDLAPLVLSIRAQGVITPILLSPHPVASAWNVTPFMIVSGHRRWAAARSAGLQQIPANLVARALSAADRLMVQLDENDGALRRELGLGERVDAVVRAFWLSGMGREQFALAHGKTPGWISHHLALANADDATRAALAEGRLTGMATARHFLRVGAEDRAELLERARRTGLPITERLIEAAAQRQERGMAQGAARPARGARVAEGRSSAEVAAVAEAAAEAAPEAGDGGRAITFAFSPRQLENLIVMLGEEPGPTAEEQILQLESLLD